MRVQKTGKCLLRGKQHHLYCYCCLISCMFIVYIQIHLYIQIYIYDGCICIFCILFLQRQFGERFNWVEVVAAVACHTCTGCMFILFCLKLILNRIVFKRQAVQTAPKAIRRNGTAKLVAIFALLLYRVMYFVVALPVLGHVPWRGAWAKGGAMGKGKQVPAQESNDSERKWTGMK